MQADQFAAHARAEDRHWWFTARREILVRLTQAVAAPGLAVADVGCGTGGNAAALAAEGYRVLGLDRSEDAITIARRHHPRLELVQAEDPRSARHHLAQGGVLLMCDVLEHVEDDRGLLALAIEAVPPGGHLLLTVPADPALWSGHDIAFGHHRRYRPLEFAALWADRPVSARLLSPFNARLRPLVMMYRRVFGRHAGSGGDLDVPMGPLNTIFHRIFASEAGPLAAAIDRGRAPWRRGVSLVALLRRE